MKFEYFIALCILSFTAAFTPGPNNALVAASGANFGFRRTFPHVLGISFGFPVMIIIVGLFLGQLIQSSLFLREALRWIGVGLLLYVAYKIATAGGLGSSTGERRPFRFHEAPFFNGLIPRGGRWRLRLHRNSQPLMPPCKRPSSSPPFLYSSVWRLHQLGRCWGYHFNVFWKLKTT